MTFHVHMDTEELDMLAAWLREAPAKASQEAPAVVRKGAMNIKDEWRAAAAKSKWFTLADSISFDEKVSADVVEAEIGPDRAIPAARLGGIAHFGGANGGGGTIGDPVRFLESERPGFEKALADIVDKALP